MHLHVTNNQYNDMIATGLDELPDKYTSRLNNVLITFEDDPSLTQRKKLNLRCDQTLFGLYEGVPLPARGSGYQMVLPDKITLFKNPMLHVSVDESSLRKQVKHTLWHEMAHYFGLNHDKIHEIERRWI